MGICPHSWVKSSVPDGTKGPCPLCLRIGLIPWSLGVEALILWFLETAHGKDGCGPSQQIPEIFMGTYFIKDHFPLNVFEVCFSPELGRFLTVPLSVLQVWAKPAAPALDWTPQCLQRCSGSHSGMAEGFPSFSLPVLLGFPHAPEFSWVFPEPLPS